MDDLDQHLCGRLATGDRTALAELYDRHGALCYRTALGACGSSTLAEDAVQEVFMRIARDPTRPAAAANLVGYLMRMVRHAALDLARARPRHRPFDSESTAPVPCLDPERDERVATALAALPAEQREVVRLRVWENRTIEEAAAILGISPNTAGSRWRYALEKLARLLKGIHES